MSAPDVPARRRLVLLRHGRTAWNLEGRAQGHSDVELDEVGHEQARVSAPHVARVAPDLVWSSDLCRASTTASYVAEELGADLRTDTRLRERGLGVREGLTLDEFEEREPAAYAAWRAADGAWGAVPGAEDDDAVAGRTVAVLTELMDGVPAGGTALAVAHGACLKAATGRLLGWPPAAHHQLGPLDNCGWVVLDEDGRGGGGFRLHAWNRVAPGAEFASGPGVG